MLPKIELVEMLSKVISQANVDHVEKWFERADKIVIVSHVSPDGDAIGSSLGLYHFLMSQDKTVHVIVPNAFPDFLKWMPGAKEIIQYNRYKEFADKLIQEAEAFKQERINEATGQVARFEDTYAEYIKYPLITKKRMFYETMEDLLPSLKVIIDNGSGTQTMLPLEPFAASGGVAVNP